MTVTDGLGFKFALQESTESLTPMPPSDSGINVSAPPGFDWLSMRFKVTNLQTDRTAQFDIALIEFAGPCYPDETGGMAPNGQCIKSSGALDYKSGTYDDGDIVGLSSGGAAEFHLYQEWSTSGYDLTKETIWWNGGLSGFVGGQHLTPLPSGQ